MADEPGGWELKRSHEQLRQDMREGFAQMNSRLDQVVTASAFTAEQRRVDDKLKDLAEDIANEREQRQQAMTAESASRTEGDLRQQVALDKLVANQKWLIAAVLLPLAFFIITTLISLGVI